MSGSNTIQNVANKTAEYARCVALLAGEDEFDWTSHAAAALVGGLFTLLVLFVIGVVAKCLSLSERREQAQLVVRVGDRGMA